MKPNDEQNGPDDYQSDFKSADNDNKNKQDLPDPKLPKNPEPAKPNQPSKSIFINMYLKINFLKLIFILLDLSSYDDDEESSGVGFLAYFLIISAIFVVGYIAFHNKAKVSDFNFNLAKSLLIIYKGAFLNFDSDSFFYSSFLFIIFFNLKYKNVYM